MLAALPFRIMSFPFAHLFHTRSATFQNAQNVLIIPEDDLLGTLPSPPAPCDPPPPKKDFKYDKHDKTRPNLTISA